MLNLHRSSLSKTSPNHIRRSKTCVENTMQPSTGEEEPLDKEGETSLTTPKVAMPTSLGVGGGDGSICQAQTNTQDMDYDRPTVEKGITMKRFTTLPTFAAKKVRVEQDSCGESPTLGDEESAEPTERGHPTVGDDLTDASTMNDVSKENNPWKTHRNPRFPAQTKTLRRYKILLTLSSPETTLTVVAEKSRSNDRSCDDLIDELH
ncbi:hypothetical protein V8C42DRAFT_358926 [Trichoderma barbatum]